MKALGALAILLGLFSSGCMVKTTQTRLVSDSQREVMVEPKSDQSSVTARLVHESGVVRGKLLWTNSCRTGTEEHSHLDVIESKKPNYGLAVAGLVAGALVAGVSTAILSNSENLSDVETCDYDINDNYRCSSPRQDATLFGVAGMVTAFGMAVGGVGTLAARSTSNKVEEIPEPPRLLRVSERSIPCGNGPVVGVGVALYQAFGRLAASTTNTDGDFALVVPARTTGRMAVRIESAPAGFEMIRLDVTVGTIEIPAVAEAGPDAAASLAPEPPSAS